MQGRRAFKTLLLAVVWGVGVFVCIPASCLQFKWDRRGLGQGVWAVWPAYGSARRSRSSAVKSTAQCWANGRHPSPFLQNSCSTPVALPPSDILTAVAPSVC